MTAPTEAEIRAVVERGLASNGPLNATGVIEDAFGARRGRPSVRGGASGRATGERAGAGMMPGADVPA